MSQGPSSLGTMAPPVSLDGPIPLAPPYGLLPTVDVIQDGDEHWINGAQIWGYPPAVPSTIAGCEEGTNRVKDDAVGPLNPVFNAFTAYLPFTCTKRSFRNYDEIKARLLRAFDARLSFAAEQEFANAWQLSDNPHLTDSDMVAPNGATPVAPAEGLAILEDYIGESGAQGVIHATPGSLTALTNTIVNPVGGKLRTLVGNLFVSGGGYIGATPVAHPGALTDDQAWLFATGLVQARRTEPFIPQDLIEWALDREDNTVTLYAERYVLIDWDAEVHAGVLIDRSLA